MLDFTKINVDDLVYAFGGMTSMSRALGHKYPTTVQGWKEKNKIPPWRIPEIRAAAEKQDVDLFGLQSTEAAE